MNTPAPKPLHPHWDDPYPKKKRHLPWPEIILCLPLLYVLSVGPVSALASRGTPSSASLDTIYKPLHLLADEFSPAERLLTWYVGLWVATPPESPDSG